MVTLSITPSPLFLFILLLFAFSQVKADAERKCFVCTDKTSEKCEGPLSPSDTGLIKACDHNHGNSSEDGLYGCMAMMVQSDPNVHPRVTHIWRDCLYESDMNNFNRILLIGKSTRTWFQNTYYETTLLETDFPFEKINKERKLKGRQPLPTYEVDQPIGAIGLEVYYHPDKEIWNVSNGLAIQDIFPEPEFNKEMPNISCFVCSSKTPGCQNELTSSNTSVIRQCAGSGFSTLPIGCQIIIGQDGHFYRDCLYGDDVKCYDMVYRAEQEGNETWSVSLGERAKCLNRVMNLLGLPHFEQSLPVLIQGLKRPMTVLYRAGNATCKSNWNGEMEVLESWNDWNNHKSDLSNGKEIVGGIASCLYFQERGGVSSQARGIHGNSPLGKFGPLAVWAVTLLIGRAAV